MAHEIIDAFMAEGLELTKKLRDMLDEQPQHTTERRGCGLTQATRLLAEYVNRSRSVTDAQDLSIFTCFSRSAVNSVGDHCIAAGWPSGWRELEKAPKDVVNAISSLHYADELMALSAKLGRVRAAVTLEESKLVLSLMADILSAGSDAKPQLPFMADKPEIGSCSQAEEFFLKIAHGLIRRLGHVNIIIDADARPVLVEKMNMGESHSAIFLEPVNVGGVVIPPGGLAALEHAGPDTAPEGGKRWQILTVDQIAKARFLRLTTLAVSPENRQRAFSSQYKRQLTKNMVAPGITVMDDLRNLARDKVASA